MNLQDAIILLTGARRGIGWALFQEFTARGVTVIGCSLTGDAAHSIQAVDVRDSSQVQSFVDAAVRTHGRIDAVIANAGWISPREPLSSVRVEDYSHQMQTNVDGTFFLLRAALPVLRRQNSGAVVAIGSRAGRRGHPYLSVYCASKFAVKGMMESLSRELIEEKSAVRSFLISPGGVDTDMRAGLYGEEDSRRQQSPKEVARIVAQILSEEISVPHGADISIVGGAITDVVTLS